MPEFWDVYDRRRQPAGRLHQRGTPLTSGDYHIVVSAWVLDSAGRLLVDLRHGQKPFGLLWETTGGSATAGEDSRTAILRELEEELGLRFDPGDAVLADTRRRDSLASFLDSWMFRWDGGAEELTLQEDEVLEAKWVTPQEYRDMKERGELVPHMPDLYARCLAILRQQKEAAP